MLQLFESAGLEPERQVRSLHAALIEPDPKIRLTHLNRATDRAAPWADELRREIYAGFWPAAGTADWPALLAEIAELAKRLGALDKLRDAEAIAIDLERPLRVALLGEFNAGRSSFINALLGEPVAPVGILPTTATINHLVWAPDRFARIERRAGAREPDRVVAHGELKAILSTINPGSVEQVAILHHSSFCAASSWNSARRGSTRPASPTASWHAMHSRSRTSVIFVLDAVQPLKESERTVIEQIARLGIPLVVLVNKLDRLADEAAARDRSRMSKRRSTPRTSSSRPARAVLGPTRAEEPCHRRRAERGGRNWSRRRAELRAFTLGGRRAAGRDDSGRPRSGAPGARAPEKRAESSAGLPSRRGSSRARRGRAARRLLERSTRMREVAVRARTSRSALEHMFSDQLELVMSGLSNQLSPGRRNRGRAVRPALRRRAGAEHARARWPNRAARWASDLPEDSAGIARRLSRVRNSWRGPSRRGSR